MANMHMKKYSTSLGKWKSNPQRDAILILTKMAIIKKEKEKKEIGTE